MSEERPIKGHKMVTAAEMMAELDANPEIVARREQRDKEFELRDAELAEAERPLVTDLKAHGCFVGSVYDLVNSCVPYPQGIPTLIAHLEKHYPDRIIEGILRALTVPDAAGIAARPLIDFFRQQADTSSVGLKWVAGNALVQTLTEDYISEVIGLVSDPSHGEARMMLPYALARFKDENPIIESALRSLAKDRQIGRHAMNALRGESPFDRV